MAKVLTGQAAVGERAYWLVEQPSRVISLFAFVKASPQTHFAVSEAISNPFRVLRVQVWIDMLSITAIPQMNFVVTTGVGREVDAAIVRAWDNLLPLRVEGGQVPWECWDVRKEFDWTMRKPFEGQGRRLGFWVQSQVNVALAYCYCSIQVEEG